METIREYLDLYIEHKLLCGCDVCILVRKWYKDIQEHQSKECETDFEKTRKEVIQHCVTPEEYIDADAMTRRVIELRKRGV